MISVKKLFINSSEKNLLDISFDIVDSLALVGESGSGKSLTIKAMLDMLPAELDCKKEIVSDFELKRGENISVVVQNPFTALSPLTKIKDQFFINKSEQKDYLKMVELDSGLLDRFPSELSGGQLQRVVLAMALSIKPKLLLLDEPTTALDSKTKESIISLIKDLKKSMGFSLLFVTHEIMLTKELCEDIAVLKSGKIVERGKTKDIFKSAKEDYTKVLIESSFLNRDYRE